jgi:hypothetical protein
MAEHKPNYRLYEKRGETSIFIDVEVDENENVVLSGQDVGKAPKEFWGDSDYEYWIIVNRDQKDLLLLSLIEKNFGGTHEAFSKFREFLIERGIPYEYGSWI